MNDNTTTTTDDPMFSSRTDPELLTAYNDLVDRVRAAGMQVDEQREFADRQALIDACQKLHDALAGEKTPAVQFDAPTSSEHDVKLSDINPAVAAKVKEARAKRGNESVPEGSGPGLRRLRKDPRAATTRQQVLTDQKRARADAEAKAAAARTTQSEEKTMTDVGVAGNAGGGTRKGKKAAAKPAKKAAKGAAAKPAKKAAAAKPAKKAAKGAATVGRSKFADTQKIRIVGDIPGNENGAAYARRALLKKHNGKSVGTFKSAGGQSATLANAVRDGWAKVD